MLEGSNWTSALPESFFQMSIEPQSGSHIGAAGHALGLQIGKRLLVDSDLGSQIGAAECI